MGERFIDKSYRSMSPDDRRTFDRWLRANVAVGIILAAGLVAMALASSNSVGQRDVTIAKASAAVYRVHIAPF